jgi:putative cell wall-binding protein
MTEALRPLRGSARLIALASALSASVALSPLAGIASADTTHRLEAADNVEAALAWSQFTFADGSAPTALLARDDLFADSLSSGSAQGRLNAPLLLTASSALDPRAAAELTRLGTRTVHILGGEVAVSATVQTTLETAGFTVNRVSGPTRIETAIAVANTVFPVATQVVVARAYAGGDPTQAFADSLVTGAFTAATNMPVLYTETGGLTETTRQYLTDSAVEFVNVAGGTQAVSAGVVAEIEAILEAKDAEGGVTRLAGPNRFATAVQMNTGASFSSAGSGDRVLLIEGQSDDAWASGFTAAVQAAGEGAPLVLANGDNLPPETAEFLDDADGRVALVCGPFTTDDACDAASDAMGNE